MGKAEKKLIRTIIRGFSRATILWLIRQKPISGYSIVKEVEKLTGQKTHVGIIYPLLYELEEEGFISSGWSQKGGRRIKYYSITEKGIQMLNRLHQLFKMPIKEVLNDFIGDSSSTHFNDPL